MAGSPTGKRNDRWRELLVLTPLTLLLSRAFLSLEIVPAGVAFFAAMAVSGLDHLPWYFVALMLSLISSKTPTLALVVLPPLLLLLLVGQRRGGKKKRPLLFFLATAALTFIGHFVFHFFRRSWPGFPWLLLAAESGAVFLLGFVFLRALPFLRQKSVFAYGGEEDLFLALTPLVLATVALARVNLFEINLASLAACFLIVLAGYLGGPGLGAGMGLLFFLLPGWQSFTSWPLLLGWALGGLLAGMVHRYGRLAAAVGFSLGSLLPLLILGEGLTFPLLTAAGRNLIGLAAFLALPCRSFKNIGFSPPEEDSWRTAKRKEQARLRT
ncbi:MAG: hypothetical protein GX493_06410, partial [Firmicutes bacterium]|nr:hypothetical protein [Bacillota bacterium]